MLKALSDDGAMCASLLPGSWPPYTYPGVASGFTKNVRNTLPLGIVDGAVRQDMVSQMWQNSQPLCQEQVDILIMTISIPNCRMNFSHTANMCIWLLHNAESIPDQSVRDAISLVNVDVPKYDLSGLQAAIASAVGSNPGGMRYVLNMSFAVLPCALVESVTPPAYKLCSMIW